MRNITRLESHLLHAYHSVARFWSSSSYVPVEVYDWVGTWRIDMDMDDYIMISEKRQSMGEKGEN